MFSLQLDAWCCVLAAFDTCCGLFSVSVPCLRTCSCKRVRVMDSIWQAARDRWDITDKAVFAQTSAKSSYAKQADDKSYSASTRLMYHFECSRGLRTPWLHLCYRRHGTKDG